jgi:PAS domain S-box-containing protein
MNDSNSEEMALAYAQEILATLREPFLVLNKTLRVKTVNSAFYETFQVSEEETKGRFVYELGNGQWDIPALRILLEKKLPEEIAVHDFEVEHEFQTIGQRSMMLNARRFPPEAEDPDLILLAIEDITIRRQMELALKDSELRFRRLFQTAKDGILILDAETGRIIDANPFMSGLLGYEQDEFRGKELWEIGLFEDEDASRLVYEELREKHYIRYEHIPLKAKSGREVAVEIVSNVYKEDERHVAQCNIRDITERVRLEKKMQEQATALADLHRRKDEFLAMLSHELRNPLSPILNAVHLLRLKGDEDPMQREARNVIERQVGQLSRLVDDLLEVSRMTGGKIRILVSSVDLRGVVGRAVESVRPLLDRHRHTLSVTMPSEPLMMDADPTRLEQVIVNLLNNAAKYTHDEGLIDLKVTRDGESATIRIRDNGVGLAPELVPIIFDLFTQADRSLDRSQGGLGIGLALVQRLVELHHGTVEAHSEGVGRGSEFVVRLPVLPIEAGQDGAGDSQSQHIPTRGVKVLLVDDSEDSTNMFGEVLRLLGYEVRITYTGPNALRMVANYQPDVVFLDIGLPEISGYEVARRMRLLPNMKNVKLVAMTGYGHESDRELSKEAGFDLHETKPVNLMRVEEILLQEKSELDH